MEHSLATISDTVWFTPALLVMLAMTALLWEVVRQKSPTTAYGSVPRPPGESFRLDLDTINEKLVVRLLFTLGFALSTGIAARAIARGNNFPLVYAVMFGGSGVALALTLWTWRLLMRWRHSHLGFEGERLVGRHLNLLMLDGCRVFHDLPDKQIGNIDHIVVAPHAIFVVETMTLRERRLDVGNSDHRVVFNGHELRFPTFTTSQPVKQATRNAKWLEQYIARTTGLKLPVRPILALPGWSVQRTGASRLLVVNHKELATVIVDKAATALYEAQRQRVITLLDEKCQYTPA